MSITLSKNNPSSSAPVPPQTPVPVAGGEDELRRRIGLQVFDGYCDDATRNELIRQGVNECGLTPSKSELLIEMELEASGIVNEKKLLKELDAILRQFTDKDKKLDPKERNDAIQLVCKARPGYTKGLKYDLAERFINDFCRTNNVRVKTGMFQWKIP